jgi:nucleoside phosphorylase
MKLEDYTVGWICALSVEMAAAVGMLDERHETLPYSPHDHNSYAFGRIADHNVVIACLPDGIMGTISAAGVATQMLSTFKRLRFGLMVGIGSGVPSEEHDIRLGDVVVSKPTGGYGGVIQYDFGRTVQDGKFTRTGLLNKPPGVLLAALANLQAKHMMESPELAKYISEVMRRYPKMTARYAHPGVEHDSLYAADYEHPRADATCSQCDISRLIIRDPRSSGDPAIHYGLIASGNMLMRNAATRDRLRKELDVLCFEMEGTGLMDSFPCLVIRGICDYADSHKNRRWQPYAAMTAAAYAKELICTVPVHAIESSATAADVLDLDVSGTETLENASQSSMTLIGDSDLSLISTAAEEVAHVLASDRRLKPLYWCLTHDTSSVSAEPDQGPGQFREGNAKESPNPFRTCDSLDSGTQKGPYCI